MSMSVLMHVITSHRDNVLGVGWTVQEAWASAKTRTSQTQKQLQQQGYYASQMTVSITRR